MSSRGCSPGWLPISRRRAAARRAIAHRPPVAVSRRRPGQVHRWRSPGGARKWPYPRPTAVRHILPNVLRMAGDPAAATNTSPSLRPVRFTCSASATLTTSGSGTVRNDVAVFESRRSGWERRHPRAHPLPPVDGACADCATRPLLSGRRGATYRPGVVATNVTTAHCRFITSVHSPLLSPACGGARVVAPKPSASGQRSTIERSLLKRLICWSGRSRTGRRLRRLRGTGAPAHLAPPDV